MDLRIAQIWLRPVLVVCGLIIIPDSAIHHTWITLVLGVVALVIGCSRTRRMRRDLAAYRAGRSAS